MKLQRAAGGGIAVWSGQANGLSRAAGNLYREYGLSGTEPVINQECMLVHERVDVCQFEWYRDNIDYITVSNRKVWGVFFI